MCSYPQPYVALLFNFQWNKKSFTFESEYRYQPVHKFFPLLSNEYFHLFQTQSDFSDTSSVSESRHLFEDDRQGDKEQTNVPMTSFNFINSIIGSGIIGKL